MDENGPRLEHTAVHSLQTAWCVHNDEYYVAVIINGKSFAFSRDAVGILKEGISEQEAGISQDMALAKLMERAE